MLDDTSQASDRSHHSGASNSVIAIRPVPLNAEAPSFTPSPISRPSKAQSQFSTAGTAKPQPENLSQSTRLTSTDFTSRIHRDIASGVYECAICTNELTSRSRIWSCRDCWTAFHLGCVSRWSAKAITEHRTDLRETDTSSTTSWRCPGCNLTQHDLPTRHYCWCGKELDPRPTTGVPPHSCGQTCGRSRPAPSDCPHPCNSVCHAGPCAPCHSLGPETTCFCQKSTRQTKCMNTDYKTGWSCETLCAKILPCGQHECKRTCHSRPCGPCVRPLDSRCYCGKQRRLIPCSSQLHQPSSSELASGDVESWMGSFDCKQRCERLFDCGLHRCFKTCHAQNPRAVPCPRAPSLVRYCFCGKTPLDELALAPRTICSDPIPNCSKSCEKRLECGHLCSRICHNGPCTPCLEYLELSCRCGRTKSRTFCHQGIEVKPSCSRICRINLNCGRHECGQRCCDGEQKALQRQAHRRKLKALGTVRPRVDDVEAEHICTRVCGRTLKCGNHTCPDLCHRGPCSSCREAIFDEISCHCGKTVLIPPQACGTKISICRYQCQRRKTCLHPQTKHECHGEAEACPPCPFLCRKVCLCGKASLDNQPCFLTSVRCGAVCGRALSCGLHFCRKTCHAPGDCEEASDRCTQACGKPRRHCGHPCQAPCHASDPCPETNSCAQMVKLTCPCQRRQTEVKCGMKEGPSGGVPNQLECDVKCVELARKRQLADALGVDISARNSTVTPYSDNTLSLYRKDRAWGNTQEQELRQFAQDGRRKNMNFKPMSGARRAFLHALAEDYGLDSVSLDAEPQRHVSLFKTSKFVSSPEKLLGECIQNARADRPPEAMSTPVTVQSVLSEPKSSFNAILLSNLRFGITAEELTDEINEAVNLSRNYTFTLEFLSSSDVVVLFQRKALNAAGDLGRAELEAIRSSFSEALRTHSFADSLQLCNYGKAEKAVRREREEEQTVATGWSKVAARAIAPRTLQPTSHVGQKSTFTVLASRSNMERDKKLAMKNTTPALNSPKGDDDAEDFKATT